MKHRAGVFLLACLLLPLEPVRSDPPVTFWCTEGRETSTSWQRVARSSFFGLDLEIRESGHVESPGQGMVQGTYAIDTPQYRIQGRYEERRSAQGAGATIQRVYRETFIDAYSQGPADGQQNERTWSVAGTVRAAQAALSPLYGRPALPTSPGLVRRAQTAPRRARLLAQAWAGARHQAEALRSYLVSTSSPTDRPSIPWARYWSYGGPPQRLRTAIPGVVWPAAAETARYVSSAPVRVTVPPNLPPAWRAHRGPLPGVQVANVVPRGLVAPPAVPALGSWRLTLIAEADVFLAGDTYEVYLPLHVELLLAWWGLAPLGRWEPGIGTWGRFLAQNGALREWGLEQTVTGAPWLRDGAALIQRNRLRWSGGGGIAVNGWRCAVNPMSEAP